MALTNEQDVRAWVIGQLLQRRSDAWTMAEMLAAAGPLVAFIMAGATSTPDSASAEDSSGAAT